MDLLTQELINSWLESSPQLIFLGWILIVLLRNVAPIMDSMRGTIEEYKEEKQGLRKEIKELKETVFDLDNEKSLIESRYEKLKHDMQKQYDDLCARYEQLKEDYEALLKINRELREENKKVTTENHDLKKLIDLHPEVKKALDKK
jgi:chromosome segregation ATPase